MTKNRCSRVADKLSATLDELQSLRKQKARKETLFEEMITLEIQANELLACFVGRKGKRKKAVMK